MIWTSYGFAAETAHDLKNVLAYLKAAALPVEIGWRPYRAGKSPSQLRYAHHLIGSIANAKGLDPDDVKTDAKREYGIIELSTSAITGERTARLLSLREYSAAEASVFISQLEAFCDAESIPYIPPPDVSSLRELAGTSRGAYEDRRSKGRAQCQAKGD